METIMKKLDKIIIDPSAKNLVPYLPLNQITNKN